MSARNNLLVRQKLEALRTELADLAFVLERRGRIDAADVAMAVSARIGECAEELATARATGVRLDVRNQPVRSLNP